MMIDDNKELALVARSGKVEIGIMIEYEDTHKH